MNESLDKATLLGWLSSRPGGRVSQSIYQGLTDRIRRGDFDTQHQEGGE